MQFLTITADLLKQVSSEANELNQQISFQKYLLSAGYTAFSERLFMKENPLELIRISQKNGTTIFRNFENKDDHGRLLDFIRNRSLEDGKVIPNKKIHTMIRAIQKANHFNAVTALSVAPTQPKNKKPRQLQPDYTQNRAMKH